MSKISGEEPNKPASVSDGQKRGGESTDTTAVSKSDLQIIAIGASAGGLEPLEQLFDNMPGDLDAAYVVIQHLSPDFKSMMDELLSRHSSMQIVHPANGQEVQPNTIYLNPPREEMEIRDGKLWLTDTQTQTDLRLPIDTFMKSLAVFAGKQSIGIILSGTGSDGSAGADTIRKAGGTVIVQEPASAKFDGMPRAALRTDYPVLTALPEAIGDLLLKIKNGNSPSQEDGLDQIIMDDPHRDILRMLEQRYATDFNYYKLATVERRITRRATMQGINSVSEYANLCRNSPDEVEALYSDLLIGVTAFFRDGELFELLRQDTIPALCKSMSNSHQIRLWTPGCATGEEAYSFAILISEYARQNGIDLNAKIFASDIHFRSLEIATRGEYSAEALSAIPEPVRERYFDKVEDAYKVTRALRSLVVFSNHNVIRDPPFTGMHMVSCRNLLIYFKTEAQHKALAMFHFALTNNGLLLLGPSETTGDLSEEFIPVNQKWRIYAKLRDVTLPESTRLLPLSTDTRKGARRSVTQSDVHREYQPGNKLHMLRAYDGILAKYAPPGLLTSRGGELLHVFGNGRKYIDVPTGMFSPRVTDIVQTPFKAAVSIVHERAKSDGAGVIKRDIILEPDSNAVDELAEPLLVTIQGEALSTNGANPEYILLTFNEKKAKVNGQRANPEVDFSKIGDKETLSQRIAELERDLQFTEESLQSTIEELETSNEEMQASNEELMSANEELQSTNEELHSVNEELFTISSEHQRKIEELTEVTTDMEHLFRSTDVGTLFLDEDLRIRRFTPNMAQSFNLLERDVGRPLEHVTTRLNYSNFMQDVRSVMAGRPAIDTEVSVDSLTFLLRILPYRVPETDEPKGIVVTLTDVTRIKKAERNLEARNRELALVNKNLEQFTYIVSHDLRAPLRAIKNAAQWVEEDFGGVPNEKVGGHLSRMRRQSARLSEMLTDLLEYSRLGSEEQPTEDVDLNNKVREISHDLDYDTEVRLDTGKGLPSLRSHRAPLRLVFQNLIDNAVKYCGSRTSKIKIRARRIRGGYAFLFIDNGPGISPEFHEKIFLPFQKLEHRDQTTGNGMGLALVRKAIEAHGGQIKVKSRPDQRPGTCFVFTWMIEQASPAVSSE